MCGHRNIRLGAKILHDDFLDVPKLLVHLTDGQQRVDALLHRFANSDQDTGGECDGTLPCFFHGAQPQRRDFVGALACGNPLRISRALTFSSIRPTLAFDSLSLSSAAPSITPGFACGRSPVRSNTNSHMAAT